MMESGYGGRFEDEVGKMDPMQPVIIEQCQVRKRQVETKLRKNSGQKPTTPMGLPLDICDLPLERVAVWNMMTIYNKRAWHRTI